MNNFNINLNKVLPLKLNEAGFDKYSLSIDYQTNRITGVTYDLYGNPDDPRVTILPPGAPSDYLYINNEYVYSPEYPLAEENYEEGQIFYTNSNYYEALASIAKDEQITEENAKIVDTLTVFNKLKGQNEMLLECILEMSEILYE